jgi:hypothetical protein
LQTLEDRIVLDAGPVYISELMAVNGSGLADKDGETSDWLEIHNPTLDPVPLDGYFLTDSASDLTRWRIPDVTLASGEYLVVFASSKNLTDPNDELHTDFKLGGGGEYLAIVRPDGVTISHDYDPEYPAQLSDVSYGLASDNITEGFFVTPTPNGPPVDDPIADATQQVIINEIMYHPDSETVADEYIEIYNRGAVDVPLLNWQFTAGVDFTFPDTTLAAGEFLVVAADVASFQAKYPTVTNVVGGWVGQLSNKSESIRLANAIGDQIDQVTYADSGEWATRAVGPNDGGHTGWIWFAEHDGLGKSLELVNPAVSNNRGQNWETSIADQGTPGVANWNEIGDVAPFISDVQHSPAIPKSTDSVVVTARANDELAVGVSMTLYWRIAGAASFTTANMVDDGTGDDASANNGNYTATLPPQADRAVVEFYVESSDQGGKSRQWPKFAMPSNQPLTNALYQVSDSFDIASHSTPGSPVAFLSVMTPAERTEFAGINRQSDAQMNATFITVDGTGVNVRYNTGIRIRGSGSRNHNPPNNRVNFTSDNPLDGKTSLNINADTPMDQIAGAALHVASGLPTPLVKPVMYFSNDSNLYGAGNFYAHVETLNGEFARDHFDGDGSGNVYKGRRSNESPPGGQGAGLYYRGHGDPAPYFSYSKLSNESEADWTDVMDLTFALNNAPYETYVEDVRAIVNVEQWFRILALNALMDNSEGGLFNGDTQGDDYAMYHGEVDGRFFMLPHDLDTLFSRTTRGFTRFLNVPALRTMFEHPEFRRIYYQQLNDLMDNVLTPANLQSVLSEAYGTARTQGQIDSIKTFLANRFNYVRPRIPAVLRIDHDLNVVDGYPQSSVPHILIDGVTPLADTASITVNGEPTVYGGAGNWSAIFADQPAADLISTNSTWSYLDNRVDQGTAWRETAFDDSSWPEGAGILGAGDGGLSTTLALGPADDRTPTFYFRHEFDVADPAEIARLDLGMIRDDGAVVYLNGIEQFRSNMPGTVIEYGTFASSNTGTANERTYFPFALNPQDLVAGSNLLAVEVHQSNTTSNDVSFDVRLEEVRAGDLSFSPGLNRLHVEVFDDLMGAGNRLYSDTLDVWYDGPTVSIAAETLAANETWSSSNGTYVVAGDVVVPVGVTLTIEPGTTVFFAEDATLTIDGGRLNAVGLPYNEIRLMQDPAANGNWDGLIFASTLQDNLLQYAIVQDVNDTAEVVRVTDSQLTIENVSFERSDTRRIYSQDSALVVRDSIFTSTSQNSGPDSGHADAQIVSVGSSDSQWLIQGNQFASASGENDVIRLSGPLGIGHAVPEIRGNEFLGGEQAGVSAADIPVVVDGNRFAAFLAGGTAPERAGGIYIDGDDATVTRNVLDGNTRAITVLNSAAVDFDSNTVFTTADPAIQLLVNDESPGDSISLESSIFWSVTEVLDAEGQGRATIENSMVPVSYLGFGSGNLADDPAFTDAAAGDFSLRSFSLAADSGENGLDRGAIVAAGASITGEPPALTHLNNATLLIAGPGIEQYSYRVNQGPWSGPHNISAPINLSGLADGNQQVEVEGIDQFGLIQTTSTLSQQWTVDSGLERLVISEVLASNRAAVNVNGQFPDVIELYNAGGTVIDLTGYSLSDNQANPTKYVFPADTLGIGEYLLLYADTNVGFGLETGFSLSGTGEAVYLYNATAQLLDSIEFGVQVTDLSISRLGGDGTWGLSTPTLGGENEAVLFGDGDQLSINEWFASGDVRRIDDFIEIRNGEAYPVDLSGHYLTDDYAITPAKHEIAPLSFIGANSYLEFEADRDVLAGADHLNFSLSSDQELLSLLAPNLDLVDQVYFFPQVTDYSQGRDPDGSETYSYFRLPTPDVANVPPTVDDQPAYDRAHALLDSLRITEIMYNPLAVGDLEYLEFRNTGDQPLDISGVRIDGAVNFTFPAQTLQPGEYVVVAQDLAQFQQHYGDWISLAGAYTGSLSNGGETIIVRPEVPFESAVLRFAYNDWYASTNGLGFALELADEAIDPRDMDQRQSWQVGLIDGGAPGRGDLVVGVDSIVSSDATPAITGTVTEPLAVVEVVIDGQTYATTNTGNGTWLLANNVVAELDLGVYDVAVTATHPLLSAAVDDTVDELEIVDGTTRIVSVVVNGGITDPPDLPSGAQRTDWQTQRSELRTVVIEFNSDVQTTVADFRLTNLGINAPVDSDQIIALDASHVSVAGSTVTLTFGMNELDEGVYALEVLDTLTDLEGNALDGDDDDVAGGNYDFVGNVSNHFYALRGEWSGDTGVSVFDFPIFSYWFGFGIEANGGEAPDYTDINQDGGVSVFDFGVFADNFGIGVIFPTALVAFNAPSNNTAALEVNVPPIVGVILARAELPQAAEPTARRALDDTLKVVEETDVASNLDDILLGLLSDEVQSVWREFS